MSKFEVIEAVGSFQVVTVAESGKYAGQEVCIAMVNPWDGSPSVSECRDWAEHICGLLESDASAFPEHVPSIS